MTYKWACVHTWVLGKIDEEGNEWAAKALRGLISVLDHDTLEDFFQSDLAQEGFYDKLLAGDEPTTPNK